MCADQLTCSRTVQCLANLPLCYATVQAAIDASDPNDIIELSAETYTEDFGNDGGASPLTLIGHGRDDTVLVGNSGGEGFKIRDVTMTISDLTFTTPGGIDNRHCMKLQNGNLTIDTVLFTGCEQNEGGGIEIYEASVFEGTDITFSNNATNGNDIGGAHILHTLGTVTCTDCTFEAGNAGGTGGVGGAIWKEDGDLTLIRPTFTTNTADMSGGAIHQLAGTLTILDGSFTANTAQNGGAIFLAGGTVDVDGTTFTNNAATTNGGALHLVGGTAVILGSFFSGNTAGADGGAIAGTTTTLTVEDSTFLQNTAQDNGGAVALSDTGSHTLRRVLFEQNNALVGGAVRVELSDGFTLEQSTLLDNRGTLGAALALVDSESSVIQQNLFCSGDVQADGGLPTGDGAAIHASAAGWALEHNGFLENAASHSGGAIQQVGQSGLDARQNSFVGNTGADGAAISNTGTSTVNSNNQLFADNTATTYAVDDPAAGLQHDYDLFFGNAAFDTNGTVLSQLVSQDPLLPWTPGSCTLADLRPAPGSPAIDGGTPGGLDPDGSPADIGVPLGVCVGLPVDADNDGFDSCTDCDENNALINPLAVDVPGDGIDQDCDGQDALGTGTATGVATGVGTGTGVATGVGTGTGVATGGGTGTGTGTGGATATGTGTGSPTATGTGTGTGGPRPYVPGEDVDTGRSAGDEAVGCGCTSAPAPALPAMLPLVGLLALRRRRLRA